MTDLQMQLLLSGGVFVVGLLWVFFSRAAVPLMMGDRRDSAIHEVGHAMVLSIARGADLPEISISADEKGVPSLTSHEIDVDLDLDGTLHWLMLVCLAGHAAEEVAGSDFNKDKKYRDALHAVSARSCGTTDAAKWEQLARLQDSPQTRRQRHELRVMRSKHMHALNTFFQLNRSLLVETAERLLENGGAMTAQELKPYLDRVRHTSDVSPAIVQATPSSPSTATALDGSGSRGTLSS